MVFLVYKVRHERVDEKSRSDLERFNGHTCNNQFSGWQPFSSHNCRCSLMKTVVAILIVLACPNYIEAVIINSHFAVPQQTQRLNQ
jgi:hypothetical protein